MRKGHSLHERSPIHFVPAQQQYLPPEVFTDITEVMVPGIQPYYMISNYGRIWHKYKCMFLTPNIDTKGYLYKNLASYTEKETIPVRIHRLVMLGFNYIPNNENMLVNHLDGNKFNCVITNLEWSTYSRNAQHAYDIGLNKGGKLETAKVEEICRLLESGKYTVKEISDMTSVGYTVVSAILGKRTYADISDNYNIEKRKVERNLSDEQVESICKFFQDHKHEFASLNVNDKCRKVMQAFNLGTSTNMLKTLQKIYTRSTYSYISREYDF